MPLCTIETNVCKENVPVNFHIKLANMLKDMLQKPLERVSVAISPGLLVTRGATTDPTATVHIWAVDVFDESKNSNYGDKLFNFFKQEWPEIHEKKLVFAFHPIKSFEVSAK